MLTVGWNHEAQLHLCVSEILFQDTNVVLKVRLTVDG